MIVWMADKQKAEQSGYSVICEAQVPAAIECSAASTLDHSSTGCRSSHRSTARNPSILRRLVPSSLTHRGHQVGHVPVMLRFALLGCLVGLAQAFTERGVPVELCGHEQALHEVDHWVYLPSLTKIGDDRRKPTPNLVLLVRR